MKGPEWDAVSDSAKDLIPHMLKVDENERFTALQVLQHPWMKGDFHKSMDLDNVKSLLCDLKGFTMQYKMQQATLAYIATQFINKKEKERLQKVFIDLDENKDGRLSQDELISGYKMLFGEDYPAEEEVEKIMQQMDIDGNGYIDLTEFIIATTDKSSLLSREKLIASFKMFDKVTFYSMIIGWEWINICE